MLVRLTHLGAWVLLLACSAARAAPLPKTRGLSGWGLDLEVPVVGVLQQAARHGHASAGGLLGFGITYERAMPWLVRVQVDLTGTRDGSAYITYLSGNSRLQDLESAAWRGALAHVGGAYMWRQPGRGWAPYAGASATLGYGGYDYLYGATALKLEPAQSVLSPAPVHEGRAWVFGGGLNGGFELQFAQWLASYAEVAANVLPLGTPGVSNNLPTRDVHSAADVIFLVQARFGVRLLF